MNFAVTPDEILSTFGLSGVVYFPRYQTPPNHLDPRTADFLGSVGLPDDETFKSKASIGQDESISVAEWFGPDDGTVPEECRTWLVLGYFVASVVALDPASGKVYAFGEGEPLDTYTQLHRDVESFVYALHLFKKFDEQERDDDIDGQVNQLQAQIEAFDALPFEDEQSQWNLTFDEVRDGIW
uniref:SUKH-4 family immunity protein n=1 Tax=Streptomyces sp. NBC_00119 TaxID=2975659 RepID=A0AAU1TYE4_9ACTN